ncbi:hypothetical protein Ancab_018620 [Ancistrocladus abbreviatus]
MGPPEIAYKKNWKHFGMENILAPWSEERVAYSPVPPTESDRGGVDKVKLRRELRAQNHPTLPRNFPWVVFLFNKIADPSLLE